MNLEIIHVLYHTWPELNSVYIGNQAVKGPSNLSKYCLCVWGGVCVCKRDKLKVDVVFQTARAVTCHIHSWLSQDSSLFLQLPSDLHFLCQFLFRNVSQK